MPITIDTQNIKTRGFPKRVIARKTLGPLGDGLELRRGFEYTATGLIHDIQKNYLVIRQHGGEVLWNSNHFDDVLEFAEVAPPVIKRRH